MSFVEKPFLFSCASEKLLGIVASPEVSKKTGVLIVVGGPQYRAGSHRQFLLLSRALAGVGYPVMRFDYRGMGDSGGVPRDFQAIGEDITAAIDAFLLKCPQLKSVVLWGLCDAASACLMYHESTKDSRISGLVLLNPWIRSAATLARTHIKHYYVQRLLDKGFWRKLFFGRVGVGHALFGFAKSLITARQSNLLANAHSQSFQQKMAIGLGGFKGPVLILLSGDDYTANEFVETVRIDPMWSSAFLAANVTKETLKGADHTFSSAELRQKVEGLTRRWLETTVVE